MQTRVWIHLFFISPLCISLLTRRVNELFQGQSMEDRSEKEASLPGIWRNTHVSLAPHPQSVHCMHWALISSSTVGSQPPVFRFVLHKSHTTSLGIPHSPEARRRCLTWLQVTEDEDAHHPSHGWRVKSHNSGESPPKVFSSVSITLSGCLINSSLLFYINFIWASLHKMEMTLGWGCHDSFGRSCLFP